eukprot:CAMPEP_0169143022 /NCGR_PEP_ID=MMETSP1015-20121227/45332_1 /TAXON_ID=342587 /ORGANISM="Karlodinium micrum, Strain CCMP2283" /LENGTH=276 /DNA_ID=CAMNT_0009209869 /DNA_START=436 /DNA_END=1267 /DNA_ORIENTATION=-
MTHLLGHHEALGYAEFVKNEYPEEFVAIKETFGDVWTSVFTLFQVTTTDNWEKKHGQSSISTPAGSFIVFTAWSILSVLTAVAANSMLEAKEEEKQVEHYQIERNRQKFILFLKRSFQEADVDQNNLLDKEEFKALLEKPFVRKEMKSLGIHESYEEMIAKWSILDYNERGELTIDEFVEGMTHLQEGLGTKHIVNVQYTLDQVRAKAEDRLRHLKYDLQAVVSRNEEILKRVKEQGESQHQQQLSFWLWQQWALRNSEALRNFEISNTQDKTLET